MGTSAHDMIGSLRYNKSLQRKKSLFKKAKSYRRLKGQYEEKAEKDNIQLKTATKEQLAAIRHKILLEKRAEKFMTWVILLISVPVLIFGGYAYYEALKPNNSVSLQNQMALNEAKKERQKQFTYFINSGDEWLGQYNWFNAIFEYKKAIEIYPTSYAAHYRLALAYTYNCQDSKENCNEAEILISKMVNQYPDSAQVYLLRASHLQSMGDSAKAMLDYGRVDKLTREAIKQSQ